MSTRLKNFWQTWGKGEPRDISVSITPVVQRAHRPAAPTVELASNDPLVIYLQGSSGAMDIESLKLESPALRALKAAGIKMIVPLLSQGELIGLLNLGPRLSDQDYTSDDRGLLNNLAAQASPAVRVAQLVQQQQKEIQERERLEQEMRVARLIQQTLLPHELPSLDGWRVNAYYQPARAVGGDFYDFIYLPDERIAFVIGDVTDKGVPAALVMATTRAILRAAATRLIAPGEVLERVNESLCPDIPPNMFVTCFYAVLDPASGRLQYANAGHDVPYRSIGGDAAELRATGMPLGLLTGMTYEEKETTIAHGERILFHSDGLVEAHNAQREMFSFPKLQQLMADYTADADLIASLRAALASFTGPGWEQEDDVTLMTLERLTSPPPLAPSPLPTSASIGSGGGVSEGRGGAEDWRTLAEFTIPSAPGNERKALAHVAKAVNELALSPMRLERLKTAVAETTMNAIEHGNHNNPDLPVAIRVRANRAALSVTITDQGGGAPIAAKEEPDLEAKLAGLQSPRGWGLFLIKNLVDEMNITSDAHHHTIELIMHLEGGQECQSHIYPQTCASRTALQ